MVYVIWNHAQHKIGINRNNQKPINMKEVEILVKLQETFENAQNILSKYEMVKHSKTRDKYYTHPHMVDLHPDDNQRLRSCFRIREKCGKNYITYKNDHFSSEDEWLYSDEWETEVASAEMINQIVSKLGFQELITVDVDKYVYEYQSGYELVLENVVGLGVFLEIEFVSDAEFQNVEEVKNEIRNKITELGFTNPEEMNAGKPELLLKKKHCKEI